MALAFGGGVRPELGRTDYTSFLQGSLAGSQMAARGGEHIGAALANLGQTAAQAIGQYQERKQEKELFNNFSERIGKILEENPAFGQQIGITDPSDKGAIKAAVKALGGGDTRKGVQAAEMLVQGAMQQQAQRGQISEAVSRFLGGDESAAANIPSDMLNALTNARRLGFEQQAGPAQPKLSFQEQQVQAELQRFSAQSGRLPSEGEVAEIYAAVAKRNAPPPSETAFGQTVGSRVGEMKVDQYRAAQALPQELEKLEQVSSLLESGQPLTGLMSDFRTNIERVKSLFLGKEEANQRIADTELLEALLGSDVFPLIGKLGIGARGIDTPAERDFLRDVFTGRAANNKETLNRLTEIRKRVLRQGIETYNKAVEAGDYDRFFEASGLPRRTINLPQPQGNSEDLFKEADRILGL
jgi:hypothetical protein